MDSDILGVITWADVQSEIVEGEKGARHPAIIGAAVGQGPLSGGAAE